MEAELQKVVEEIEAEKALGKVSAVNVFRSLLNQPDLLAISSADADPQGATTGFSSFEITLPRPMLDVDTIQLIHANIPQCVQNIPDTSLVFWYYRLSGYSGTSPNPNNLYMVRLLPTSYKPEYIPSPEFYGFNKTFHNYQELAQELALACRDDLGYYNSIAYPTFFPDYKVPFLPNEITLPYNEALNKFQFIGTNATTQFAYKEYSPSTTYNLDDVVFIGTTTYKSLQPANLGNDPPDEPTWWERVYVDIVAEYQSTTPYPRGRYVAYLDQLYIAVQNTLGNDPVASPTFWELITESGQINYRYLSTGYNDPNVALLQSTGKQQWNTYALYETGDVVEFNGSYWSATFQNQGQEPFTFSVSGVWNNTTRYRKGDIVAFGAGPRYYKAALDNFNQTPTPYSATYWILQCWTPTATPPYVVGLYEVTNQVDMVENIIGGGVLYPFPTGIAGQPYAKQPKRLLNSILGFTFNGVFNPQSLSNIPGGFFVGVIAPENAAIYNRLRPIPPYIAPPPAPPLLSLNSTSTTSQTYTADGYANLVYSSIISIYASIVAGSTINTNQNTGLLALTSMNAGNLGVSFYSQPINQPLSVNGADIYTLSLYFEDEFGEPYFFTNNAVLSFMLKITYKNKIALK